MDIVKTLDRGLYLDTLNCIIEWSSSPNDLVTIIGEDAEYEVYKNPDMNYIGYSVLSSIFGTQPCFKVVFNYVREKLTSINIGNVISQEELLSFERIQKTLESIFGKPSKSSNLFSIKNQKSYKWRLKKVIIENSLIEREGLQHMFEIIIR